MLPRLPFKFLNLLGNFNTRQTKFLMHELAKFDGTCVFLNTGTVLINTGW
jgi:hypothetical protein